MGWLSLIQTTTPCNRNSVPTVVIRDGTRKPTVIRPLRQPIRMPRTRLIAALIGKGSPQPFVISTIT